MRLEGRSGKRLSDEDIALYELAFTLGIPMYKLQDEMSFVELQDWIEFFRRRPVGWQDDMRTSFLMQAFGTKAKGPDIFPSLKTIHEEAAANEHARIAKAKRSPFIQKYLMPHLEEDNGDNSTSDRS